MLSPDASYVTAERLAKVTREDREGFPHVCPDFVIELLSKSDRPRTAKKKMERWIENGAQLAWLIDPYRKKAFVYRPGSPSLTVAGPLLDGEGPVAGFTLNLAMCGSATSSEAKLPLRRSCTLTPWAASTF
jgi:Uma2 family endonuclease